jgi:hypothetical protein
MTVKSKCSWISRTVVSNIQTIWVVWKFCWNYIWIKYTISACCK